MTVEEYRDRTPNRAGKAAIAPEGLMADGYHGDKSPVPPSATQITKMSLHPQARPVRALSVATGHYRTSDRAGKSAVTNLSETLRATARKWRNANQDHRGGVVLIWQGAVYGWKDSLRDASDESPGVYAVNETDHIFIAEGGDEYNGAKCWVAAVFEKN